MRTLIVLLLLGLSCSFPVVAGDGGVRVSVFGGVISSTLAVTFFPFTLTEDSQESSRNSSQSGDPKILAARNDAAAFVATDGVIRGVNLEAAFEVLRNQGKMRAVSEIRLAQSILVYGSR